ncbi:hypothetical protein B484DRAFT_1140 [Ochromonadaceae sp. CCMP2298]|nr:hypothetical protein B484DRAFT_1140 [Ochromonadaceae sp. CCMP2298]
MSIRGVLSSELTVCWRVYMREGRAGAGTFLHSLYKLYGDNQRKDRVDFQAVAEDVLMHYANSPASTNSSLGTSSSANNISASGSFAPHNPLSTSTPDLDPDVMVAAGCIHAIRAVYAKGKARDPMRGILMASQQVGQRLESFKSPADEIHLTAALDHLFRFSHDPRDRPRPAGPLPHPPHYLSLTVADFEIITPGTPGTPSGAGAGGGSPGARARIDNLKSMTTLALKSFEVFPLLRRVRLGEGRVGDFLGLLVGEGLWTCAVK